MRGAPTSCVIMTFTTLSVTRRVTRGACTALRCWWRGVGGGNCLLLRLLPDSLNDSRRIQYHGFVLLYHRQRVDGKVGSEHTANSNYLGVSTWCLQLFFERVTVVLHPTFPLDYRLPSTNNPDAASMRPQRWLCSERGHAYLARYIFILDEGTATCLKQQWATEGHKATLAHV